jgi:S1-C subfamily serine protease
MACKAGLVVGDVATAINGAKIQTSEQLRNAVGLLRVGDMVTLKIIHNGAEREVRAIIAEPNEKKVNAEHLDKRLSGAKLGDIEPSHPLAGQVTGVEVLEVELGGPAWEAGLRKGDIIVSVNRQPVQSVDDLEKAIKAGSNSILLNIRRGDGALFIVIH